jgi:deoxyxylulose-5-phosphate synthase
MASAVAKRSVIVADHNTSIAEYIGRMSGELAGLASKSRLRVLQHLLNMVTMEAGQRAVDDASAPKRSEARQQVRRRNALAA